MNKFILTNDPDHETLGLIKPIYEEFNKIGIKVTTGVFCKMENDGSDLSRHCRQGETDTLENPKYKDFLLEQKDKGHEIAFHGYSQVSNKREKFIEGLEIYKDTFGEYPYTYVEHGGKKGHHPDSGCKKETLIWEGKNKDSDYYVEDIIKEKIKCVWAYHSLLDKNAKTIWGKHQKTGQSLKVDNPDPSPNCTSKKDYFWLKDGIQHFSRYRLFYADLITEACELFIGYTHFGYRGYRDERGHRWEYWDDYNYHNITKNIEMFCKKNNSSPTTVKNYLENE